MDQIQYFFPAGIFVILFLLIIIACVVAICCILKSAKHQQPPQSMQQEPPPVKPVEPHIPLPQLRYTVDGRDEKGRYNRLYDRKAFFSGYYSQDGFLNPWTNRIALTDHARQRMWERMGIDDYVKMDQLAIDAYCFGKSARQMMKSSAAMVRDIEERYENSVILVYHGFIFVFSRENVLITVYKNNRIPM